MKKGDIKREIYRLRKERQLLETHCLGIGLQLPLWLSIRYVRCGKEGAIIIKYKGKGHSATSFNFLNMKNIILKFVKKNLNILKSIVYQGFSCLLTNFWGV